MTVIISSLTLSENKDKINIFLVNNCFKIEFLFYDILMIKYHLFVTNDNAMSILYISLEQK